MNDIICYEIINFNKMGLTVKNKNAEIFISFDECAKNFANENSIKKSKCVAVRDISALTFTFYTKPKIKIVFKKHFLKNLLSGKSAVSRFCDLQKNIIQSGFTSYDLS